MDLDKEPLYTSDNGMCEDLVDACELGTPILYKLSSVKGDRWLSTKLRYIYVSEAHCKNGDGAYA
jgi:hypothetical protein